MSTESSELADRLLEAQVEFVRRQLTDPDAYGAAAREELTGFLEEASQLTLSDSVTRDMIKAVAHKYAIAFPVEGAIPELVGQVAARLYQNSVRGDIALADLLGRKHVDDLVDGVADLAVTDRIVRRLLDSPATVDVCVEAVQRAVDSSRLPSGFGALVDRTVEAVTRRGAGRVLRANSEASNDVVREAIHELWRRGQTQSVGEVTSLVEEGDVEDIVVLAFEFWREFRNTEYFATLLSEGVDEVFNAYGDTTLTDLLAELGVGFDDLLEEAVRFGPAVIGVLEERDMLVPSIRRRLAPFYTSPEFLAALGS